MRKQKNSTLGSEKMTVLPYPAVKRKLIAATIAACASGQLFAQDEVATDKTYEIEEVIVTVNRREQNLQEVSATVQAFSDEDLLKLGVNSNFSNLQYVVPGLQIANQEGKIEVYLRGIGSSDSDFSSDPSVATHYNGMYLARPRGIGPLFFDVERVEVNKGPQGTIRGRNATGGTINIISNAPEIGEFTGHVGAGFGDFNTREAEAVVNLPVHENMALRLSAWSKAHDGLYSNAFSDGGQLETPSSQDDMAYRISYRWQPSDEFQLDFMYSNSDVESSGDPGVFAGRSLSAGYDPSDLSDPWNHYFRRGGLYEQEVETLMLKLSYDWESFGVEYHVANNDLRAYNKNASREWQLGLYYPGSEAEANYIASGASATNNLTVNDTFYQADKSISTTHEIRFYSNGDGRLNWTAGAFYFEEEFDYLSWDVGNGYCGDSSAWLNSPLGNTVSCWQNGLGGENRGNGSEVETLAFYADGTFSVTDQLRVLAGIRSTDEEKTQNDFNAQYQFDFEQDFFFGFPGVNEPSDLIIGGTGFTLTDPAGRSINNGTPGAGGKDLFLDGIAQFGLGDNWGDMLMACEEGVTCDITVTSIYSGGGSLQASNKVEDSYTDWRMGVEYDVADTASWNSMAYMTVSTGTRSGGINRPFITTGGLQINQEWKPEKLLAYELGMKNSFSFNDFPMILNGSLFYYDYEDYVAQLLIDVNNLTGLPGVNQQVFTDNVGNASILGLEIESNIDLPYGFNVNLSLLLMDSELDDTQLVDSRNPSSPIISVDGNSLPNVSDTTMNLRVSQTIDSPWEIVDSLDWTLNAIYRSEYFLTAYNNKGYELDANGNTVEIPLSDMPVPNNNGNLSGAGGDANAKFYSDNVDGYWLVNLNAGLNFGDGDYRLDFYVENLTEEAASTKAFVNNSVNIRYLNSPRMYGMRFKAYF
ncbi:MAG: TonB-dependent receptor [Spongiibacteraceae bacterium]|nr:TonB-dependent receptor [Spongiibacteraceae bacterium]